MALSTVLILNSGPSLQWALSTVGPLYSGTSLQWDLSTVGHLYSGPSLQWDLSTVGPLYSGTSLQWDLSTVGPLYSGTSLQWTLSTVGPLYSGTSLQWDLSIKDTLEPHIHSCPYCRGFLNSEVIYYTTVLHWEKIVSSLWMFPRYYTYRFVLQWNLSSATPEGWKSQKQDHHSVSQCSTVVY